MLGVQDVYALRHKVLVEGQSQRRVAREMGLARDTVRRYLATPVPEPQQQQRTRTRPVLERVQPRLLSRVMAHTLTGARIRLDPGDTEQPDSEVGPCRIRPVSPRARSLAPGTPQGLAPIVRPLQRYYDRVRLLCTVHLRLRPSGLPLAAPAVRGGAKSSQFPVSDVYACLRS